MSLIEKIILWLVLGVICALVSLARINSDECYCKQHTNQNQEK